MVIYESAMCVRVCVCMYIAATTTAVAAATAATRQLARDHFPSLAFLL